MVIRWFALVTFVAWSTYWNTSARTALGTMRRISKRRKRELEDYEATKLLVAVRDAGLCVRCGQSADDIAHIVPRSAFGSKTVHLKHHEKNLCCLCRPCHKATETFNGRVELLNILQELHGYDYSGPPWSQYV